MTRFLEIVGRYFLVLEVITDYAFKILRQKIFGGIKPFISPKELREILEELGGSFLKFGQLAAVRPDYFPQEYCRELLKLLDEVPPIRPELLDGIFLKEYGKKPEEVFGRFERTPFSAASFGQVHQAYLPSGEKVAVKVQRPFVAEDFALDAHFFSFLAWLLSKTRVAKVVDPIKVVQEFIRWTERELDYIKEAEHLRRLAEQARRHNFRVKIPNAHKEYSTPKILVMEFIEAETLKSYYLKGLPPPDAFKFFKEGIFFELHSFLFDGFFHADPHPANILVLPGGGLAMIDAGIACEVKAGDRRKFAKFIKAVVENDSERAVRAFLEIVRTPFLEMLNEARWSYPQHWLRIQFLKNIFLRKIKTEIAQMLESWHRVSGEKGRGREKSPLSKLLKLFSLAEEHGIAVPASVVLFVRTFFSIDLTTFELAPDFNVPAVVGEFLRRYAAELEALEELPEETPFYLEPQFNGEWSKVFASLDEEIKSQNRELLAERASAIMEIL